MCPTRGKKDQDKDNLDLSPSQLLWKIAPELNYMRVALNEGGELAWWPCIQGRKEKKRYKMQF